MIRQYLIAKGKRSAEVWAEDSPRDPFVLRSLECGDVGHQGLVFDSLLFQFAILVDAYVVLGLVLQLLQGHALFHDELELDELVELERLRAQNDLDVGLLRLVCDPALIVEPVFDLEYLEVRGLLQQVQRVLDFTRCLHDQRPPEHVLDMLHATARTGSSDYRFCFLILMLVISKLFFAPVLPFHACHHETFFVEPLIVSDVTWPN